MKAEMTHFQSHRLFVNMPFTKEYKILIKKLFELKGYNARHLVREFARKSYNVGRGRWRSARIDHVDELVLYKNG